MTFDRSALTRRPRRLREQPQLRRALGGVQLRRSDFILPVFACDGEGVAREVASMPGVFNFSVDRALAWLERRAEAGFGAFLAFGVVPRARKDESGSEALRADNVVCQLVREAKRRALPMAAIVDVCHCEYTSHGHCGPLDARGRVDNDATLALLARQAVVLADAGADVVAPSAAMDGMVGAIRGALDAAGHTGVSVLSYAVKYASAFYGPFRDAADSAPAHGDRRGYQMDAARDAREAVLEARLDIEQGADIVMVKPAGPYLDVLAEVRRSVDVPTCAYQVSGEYAALEAAARNGWLDRERAVVESLTAIKRAGADLTVTYWGELLERVLPAG